MRRVLLLSCALLAALLWLWAPWEGDTAETPTAQEDASTDAGSHGEPGLRGVGLEGQGGESATALGGEESVRTRDGAGSEGGAARSEERRVRVHLKVASPAQGRGVILEDLRTETEAELRLSVASTDRRAPNVMFSAKGRGPTITCTPGAWLRRAAAFPVQVEVNHPDYHLATGLLGTPDDIEGDLEVTLTLKPALRLRVTVKRAVEEWSSGEDLYQPKAALLPLNGKGELERSEAQGWQYGPVTRSRPIGSWHSEELLLRPPKPGRYLLVATARGYLPASEIIEIPAKADEAILRQFELTLARTITGTVRVGGRPTEGVYVEVLPPENGTRFFACGQGLMFFRGEVLPGVMTAKSERDGSYRLVGIPAGDAILTIHRVEGTAVHETVVEDVELEAPADAETVDLDIPAAWIELEVLAPDGHPTFANVHVTPMAHEAVLGDPLALHEGRDSLSTHATSQERLLVAVERDQTHVVVTEVDGMLPALAKVPALAAGQTERVTLRLEPDRSLVSLDVHVRTHDGADIRNCRIEVTREYEDETGKHVEGFSLAEMPVVEGSVQVPHLEAGRWTLRIGSVLRATGPDRFYVDTETTVEAVAGEKKRVEITLRKGGLLRVSALSKAGQHIPATCEIRDAADEIVQRRWWHVGTRGHMLNGTQLGRESASTSTKPLARGTYTLVFRQKGFAEVRKRVTIEAGRTATVEVTMSAP